MSGNAPEADAGWLLAVQDWRRRIFELYADVRRARDPEAAWNHWRATRDELFAGHDASPLPPDRRRSFGGLDYFPYDAGLRVRGALVHAPTLRLEIADAVGGAVPCDRFARVRFALADEERELDLFWLAGYAGGVFLPFADGTCGRETYGGGRYLLDAAKGADLGGDRDGVVLDFNLAYNPSCAYDPRWSCPLAPPGNRIPAPIRAGERTPLPSA